MCRSEDRCFERTILMISVNALTQLKAEELQALVAHEFGHGSFGRDRKGAIDLGRFWMP